MEEWLDFARVEPDLWKRFMAHSYKTRSPLRHHVTPIAGGLPEVERIYPRPARTDQPQWLKILRTHRRGFFVLATPNFERKILFFAATIRGEPWGLRLHVLPGEALFGLVPGDITADDFAPVLEHAGKRGMPADASLWITPIRVNSIEGDRLTWTVDLENVVQAALPVKPVKPKNDGDASEDGSEDFTDLEATMIHEDSDDTEPEPSDSTSSTDSLSDDDKDSEETGSEHEDEVIEALKEKKGHYVKWNNGYFTCSYYPLDVKIYMHDVWKAERYMRRGEMSKRALLSDYNGDATLASFVCRAWMLWRSSLYNFQQARKARREWWAAERAALKKDIYEFGDPGHSTGHAKADGKINEWCPAALGH